MEKFDDDNDSSIGRMEILGMLLLPFFLEDKSKISVATRWATSSAVPVSEPKRTPILENAILIEFELMIMICMIYLENKSTLKIQSGVIAFC